MVDVDSSQHGKCKIRMLDMIRFLFLFSMLHLILITANAQCPLTLSESPELRGFRLGMSINQVKARASNLILGKINQVGLQNGKIIYTRSTKENRDSSKVKSVELEFLDNKLASIRVTYDGSVRWNHIDDFVYKISMSLGLPVKWEGDEPSYYSGVFIAVREIKCNSFLVRARIIEDRFSRNKSYETNLLIQNTSVPEVIENRQKEVEERKREIFKP